MLAPITFERVEAALGTPAGWLELAVVLAAFLAGFIADRWLDRHTGKGLRLPGGVVRLAMPLVALLLLLVARAIWGRHAPPAFLDIGILLAVALAGIRVVVYTLRRLVPHASWLKGSERSVAFAVWTLVVLHAFGITPQIAAELDAVTLPLGKYNISLLAIAKGALTVVLTIAVTLWVSGLLEQRLMRTQIDASQRALASKFVRAALLVIGILIAFQSIGFDLTLLTVFGGALGVGIGLGLQKLASNFIAGFVILLDRSIRLGDLITVDNRHGLVTEVTSRYVVVRSMDGVEAIVPNETLVTTTVLNHSFSRRDARLAVNIMVVYGTDLDRALALMVDSAREHPRVIGEGDRAPRAFAVRFAELGIDLELGVFVRDPENGQLDVRSDLNREIWRRFREAGIGVPVTYREVRVAGAPEPPAPAPPPA